MDLPQKLNAQQKKIAQAFLDNNIPIPEEVMIQIHNLSTQSAITVKKPTAGTRIPQSAAIAREAEAVLSAVWTPKSAVTKICKSCKEKFQTTYVEAYCSNECRAAALKLIGIEWDWTKSNAERWAPTQIPGTITPQTFKMLQSYARHILEMEAPIESKNSLATDPSVSSRILDVVNSGVDVLRPELVTPTGAPPIAQPKSDTLSELDSLFDSLGF